MNIATFQKDASLADGGVWVEFEDARFKIRSTDSPTYRRILAALVKQKGTRVQKDAEALLDVSIEGLAKAVVIDWENVEENGQPLPCTLENKLKVLEIEPIRNFIAGEAQDLANFQQEATRADADSLKSGD